MRHNNIQQINMTTTDQKQNIMGLPLQERAVTVALKHIFDKIKQLQDQENQEIQNLHHSFIAKFKILETNASKIIKGNPIEDKYLNQTDKYFSQQEKSQLKQVAKNNKGIEAYWLTAIINNFKEQLTLADKQIASNIRDISTNVTKDSLEVIFEIGKNQWLEEGVISKRFVLENGAAAKVEGNNAKWHKGKPQGIFSLLFSQINIENLADAFPLASEFINEIVPYSLQHFLGADDEELEQLNGQQQENEQQQQEEQQEVAPSKKRKE